MTTMDTSADPTAFALPAGAPPSARVVFQLMRKLRHGSLTIHLPDSSHIDFGTRDGLHAAIHLHNWNACGAALKSGDIGFAESYIAGDWTTPDLANLLKLFIANRDEIETVIYGSWWGSLLYRLKHWFNRNSRAGSKKNIHAHYDLGNQFYRLWLDSTMNYSSAWFDGNLKQDLAEAQLAKVRRALKQAGVEPRHRVLEIGCGWGALAECCAREFDATVTGITLSGEQLAFGQERLGNAKLAGELRLQDYRDVNDGPYDAVVSIEMFEAVGREYWPSYFQAVRQQLKPGGRACIQAIVIREDLFERYLRTTDFIQQYVFPGGMLPCPKAFREEANRAGLKVIDEFAFGGDYAETLKRWREGFMAQDARVRQLGFDTHFIRLWEFYLAYCEAAFTTTDTNVMQFTLQRD